MADIRNDQYLHRPGAGRGAITPADPLETRLFDGSGNPIAPATETTLAVAVTRLESILSRLEGVFDISDRSNRALGQVQLTGSNVMQDVRTLSTTPLGANEFYTQTAQIAKDVVVGNVRGVAYIGAMVYADVPGVLMLQELHGSAWMESGRWPVGGGERQTIPLQPITTGVYRWRYMNGSTAQSAFELYEFVSQIDGRVRPFHIRVLQGAVIPAGGSKFMGQTQLLGYNRVAIYVRCDRQYSLDAYPGVGVGVSRSVNVVRDEAETGSGTKYHLIPSEVLPTLNLDVKITNEDPSNDATVDMWLVATP